MTKSCCPKRNHVVPDCYLAAPGPCLEAPLLSVRGLPESSHSDCQSFSSLADSRREVDLLQQFILPHETVNKLNNFPGILPICKLKSVLSFVFYYFLEEGRFNADKNHNVLCLYNVNSLRKPLHVHYFTSSF